MSKPKARRQEFVDPETGPVFSARFVATLVLAVVGTLVRLWLIAVVGDVFSDAIDSVIGVV